MTAQITTLSHNFPYKFKKIRTFGDFRFFPTKSIIATVPYDTVDYYDYAVSIIHTYVFTHVNHKELL